ncbi:MAG: biliverdin-producing heme oxygenase [Sulfuricurvum sp.]|uniref:biliverdin-producing heme oxygenase n=1 Tax=Sulfuricurvum sp. TaxID=2025608 RepID=UPI0026386F0F|nr:biliverdin-producing heme oxygenase [Sulfuricurvum sp.]MDD5158952.1 biliverdin-producing heme oxygenase [Sulfuricurvum sp.]
MTLRQRLKELTAPFHAELEKTPVAIALAEGSITREDYAIYLTKLAAIHQTLEPILIGMREWAHYEINPALRTRFALLKADLAALEQEIPYTESTVFIDTPPTFETAIGMMYVLEGSTMGGQILSRKLSHMIGADGVPCTRYFQAYGENTMRLWGEFCQFLDCFEAKNPLLSDHVILGACAMFLTIQKDMYELN